MTSTLRRVAPLAALLLACCAGPSGLRGSPESRPASRSGWRVFSVGAISFEAPASWEAGGDARRLALVPSEGTARLEAWEAGRRGLDPAACLADGEATLRTRDAGLERVQRHPSTLAGLPAVTQEADQGNNHGWAWVTCVGPLQYWLTFTGRSPVSLLLLEAWRTVVQSARVGVGR